MQYVTYGDMFTFAIVIVGILSLVFTILTFTHKK